MPAITATPFNGGHLPPASVPGLGEILIAHRDLSRLGTLDSAGTLATAHAARQAGHRAVLVWDVLASDSDLANGAALVRELEIDHFDAVRAADPGIARYVRQHFPAWPLQWLVETGNHNLPGILAWERAFQPERLILSNELPMTLIAEIRPKLQTPIEMLALGRLLIFYTPRKLISPFTDEALPQTLRQRFITSEEDRKHFPLVENRHGTFMFYEKDLFLLPFVDEMSKAGVDWIRLDLAFYQSKSLADPLAGYLQGDQSQLQPLKANLAPRLTRGFFKSNRTDKQFGRLKNVHLTPRGSEDHVGTVLEVSKKQYIALQTRGPLQVGETLRFAIPEGDNIFHEIAWLRTSLGDSVSRASEPGLWLINHGRRISPGAQAYRDSK